MKLKAVFLSLCMISAFSALAGSPDTLTIGISSEFESLHPIIANQGASHYMIYLGWRQLIVLDLDNKWAPMMIKELPTLENKLVKKNGKGLDATIEILADAKWGDGTPLTCKDVDLAWKVGSNENVSNPNREPYLEIKKIVTDANNPKKCTLSFASNKYDFYNNFPFPLPAHLEGPIFEKYQSVPQAYEQNSTYTKNPTNPGLYYGPYVVSEVKLGSHVMFAPNPFFHGHKPSLQKIVFKLIPNNGTLVANLKAGTIDMIAPGAGLGLDQAIAFEKAVKAENLPYSVVFVDGNVYAHIDLNMTHPILKDLKVRQALSYGFNRKEVLTSIFEGRGKLAYHFATDKDPWYTEKIKIYDFNRREANRLLDEAGWKLGPDKIRVKDGKRLSLTLMGSAGTKIVEMLESYLQDQWKDIGIEILIKNEPPRVYFGETLKKRNFEMALYSWTSFPEQSPRSTLHSSAIPTEKNGWAGQNQPGWVNHEVDQLIDRVERELNPEKRKVLGHKIIEQYVADVPVIPVYYRSNFSVIPKNLVNYRLSGHIYFETLYAENWKYDLGK